MVKLQVIAKLACPVNIAQERILLHLLVTVQLVISVSLDPQLHLLALILQIMGHAPKVTTVPQQQEPLSLVLLELMDLLLRCQLNLNALLVLKESIAQALALNHPKVTVLQATIAPLGLIHRNLVHTIVLQVKSAPLVLQHQQLAQLVPTKIKLDKRVA